VKVESLPQGVRLAIAAAEEKKAADITVLDLRSVGAFTEYFVICTGFSTPQVQAICTEIEEQLYENLRRAPEHREGYRTAEWALLDFGSFVVHVFSNQARRYYDLERLWRSAGKLEIPAQPGAPLAAEGFSDSLFGHEHVSGEVAPRRPHTGRSRR